MRRTLPPSSTRRQCLAHRPARSCSGSVPTEGGRSRRRHAPYSYSPCGQDSSRPGASRTRRAEPVPAAGVPAAESVPAARLRAAAAGTQGSSPATASPGTDSPTPTPSSRAAPASRPVGSGERAGRPAGAHGRRWQDGNKKTVIIAIVAAVAVVAAAVTGFWSSDGDDDKKDESSDKSVLAEREAEGEEARGRGVHGRRHRRRWRRSGRGPLQAGGRRLADRHQPQAVLRLRRAQEQGLDGREARASSPASRTTRPSKVLVAMSAPAFYKDDWCKESSRAGVGTKGAQGSKNTKEAAEIAAENFAIAGYDQKQKGHLRPGEDEALQEQARHQGPHLLGDPHRGAEGGQVLLERRQGRARSPGSTPTVTWRSGSSTRTPGSRTSSRTPPSRR